jgi:dephospho-CoA kinase
MSNKIVCIVGMAGSGKSIVADEFVKNGFSYLRFGQLNLDIIKEMGLEVNEASERKVRKSLRKEHGMAAHAILNIPKIDELLKKSNVVVDGLYSWSEYKILKEKYGDSMKVVAVFSPPEMRYDRLVNRAVENDEKQRFRSFTKEESKARDYDEIENIEKGGPIAMASYTIINTGTLEELKQEIEKIIEKI